MDAMCGIVMCRIMSAAVHQKASLFLLLVLLLLTTLQMASRPILLVYFLKTTPNKLCGSRYNMPPSVGAEAPCAAKPTANVAVGSHGEFPTVTAAAA